MAHKIASQSKSRRTGEAAKRKAPTIVLVDDDFHVRQALSRLLREDGMDVTSFERPGEVLLSRLPRTNTVLILDIYMPEMTGVALWEELNRCGYTVPTILITGHRDDRATRCGEQVKAVAVLFKPIEEKELLEAIARALAPPID